MYLAKRSGRNRVCAQAPESADDENTAIVDPKLSG
jgi:hypothetical protein